MRGLFEDLDLAAGRLISAMRESLVLALGLITLAAAILLVPGQATVPLTDRDEARYVQASKQMLETGDFIEPRNLDQPRWKKPAGIYWLQSGAALASGKGAEASLWVYRLPSALGILAAALLSVWAFRPLAGRGPSAIAGLVVATAAITVLEGHIAKTDAALFATIVLAQGALIRCLDRPPELGLSWPHALFWVALAMGTLIKGPIIFIVAGGTLLWLAVAELSFDAIRRIKLWPGVLIYAVLTAPWFVAIGFATDWGFYAEAVGQDLLGKIDGAREGHTGPPGYYLMTIWLTFWPWTPLALLAVPFAWANRKSEAMRVIAGWVIPTWAVFAVATTKLPHYVMPVLPALGALIGMWLMSAETRRGPVFSWIAALLFLFGGTVLAALPIAAPLWFEGTLVPLAALGGVIALVLVLAGTLAIGLGTPRAGGVLGVLALLVLMPALTGSAIPRLESLFPGPRMAALDARFDQCVEAPLIAAGYRELSIAFYAGSDTKLVSEDAAAEAILAGQRAFLPLESGEAIAARNGGVLHILGTVEGINYNSGPDPITLALFAAEDDPRLAPCRIE